MSFCLNNLELVKPHIHSNIYKTLGGFIGVVVSYEKKRDTFLAYKANEICDDDDDDDDVVDDDADNDDNDDD